MDRRVQSTASALAQSRLDRAQLVEYAAAAEHLELAVRNTRVLARADAVERVRTAAQTSRAASGVSPPGSTR